MNRPSYLVLDTNVWVHTTRLLSTAMGAATLHSLVRTQRLIGLPEVIEEEIKKHTFKSGIEAVESVRQNYRLIEQLMGARDDYRVPTEVDLRERVARRLEELDNLVHRVPFTLDHAKGALRRVMDETPPNGYKNQQFKDSAIWEAILGLAEYGDVHFVTEDQAFFRDRKPQLGLADKLEAEKASAKCTISVYYTLASYLGSIKEDLPPLNYSEIARHIDLELRPLLSEYRIETIELLGIESSQVSAFLTEKPNVLAIEFELRYGAQGAKLPDSEDEIESAAVVRGTCEYLVGEQVAKDILLEIIYVEDRAGNKVQGYGAQFLRGSASTQGRVTVPYVLRQPVDI